MTARLIPCFNGTMAIHDQQGVSNVGDMKAPYALCTPVVLGSLSLSIGGTPEPAGSPKIINVRGRPFIVWQKGPKWQKQIRQVIGNYEQPWYQPVGVYLEFVMPRPAKPKFNVPATKPDLDKLVRCVLDAFTGVIFDDDSRVIELQARQMYPQEDGWTGLRAMVWPCST